MSGRCGDISISQCFRACYRGVLFNGHAVRKSIEKAETIIIWPSNWTETGQGTQIYTTEVNLKLTLASGGRRQSAGRKDDTEQGGDGDETPNSDDSEPDQTEPTTRKKRCLSAFEVSEIVVEKEIKSVTELHALASEQKSEGKTDLAEFIANRVPRVVSDVVKTAWEMGNTNATLQRSRKSRMLLEEAGEGDCVHGCDGQ